MTSPSFPPSAYLRRMADGTVKQVNPFSGTQVWTVPGRGHRPLGIAHPDPQPLDADRDGHYCAFCHGRYRQTPPEKSRLVRDHQGWQQLDHLPVDQIDATTAEFRRIPNLFEILSFDYWVSNYGYTLPRDRAAIRDAYLAEPAGRDHLVAVVQQRLRAAGQDADTVCEEDLFRYATGFFGSGHDVIVGRRHFVDGATHDDQLASSGTLTPDEHAAYTAFTVDATRDLYERNRYVRYVAVFQNWLKPAGASFDHLHKQLVAIDEHGEQLEDEIRAVRSNPNLYNDAATNFANYHNLVVAENDHAVAFAGFGHRYPTLEIFSKSPARFLWEHTPDEVRGMSDLLHACHAATGADVPCNEEWHHRPPDCDIAMPWRICIKWRVSNLAGFEGGTKIYLNTVDPYAIRDRIVPKLYELRDQQRIADMQIATECACRPNSLLYHAPY